MALLSYPFLVEPFFTLRSQLILWQGGYFLFVLGHCFCLPPSGPKQFEGRPPEPCEGLEFPKLRRRLVWFLLSLGPSASLLAATNLMALDFAAVPMLWAISLSIYLLGFVLNFKARPWRPPRLGQLSLLLVLLWLVLVLATAMFSPDLAVRWHLMRKVWVLNKFVFISGALFIVCFYCNRALYETKPPAEFSPSFYLWIAFGGWIGSLLIGVLMPWLFRHTASPELDWAVAGGMSLGALILKDFMEGRLKAFGLAAIATTLIFLAASLSFYMKRSLAFAQGRIVAFRNFYGYYTVTQHEDLRRFFHGNTLHGMQDVRPGWESIPLLYYHKHSPLGEIFESFGASSRGIGVVGLGVGVVAAFGRPGQKIDFYELDLDVATVAREHFSVLKKSQAQIEIVTGDARLSLERNPARYDLLILDAFSGGAIPVHLLTREALELYSSRLSPQGLMVFNVTNRFLNLRPVLAALALSMGLQGVAKAVDPKAVIKDELNFSSWVVLSPYAGSIQRLKALGWKELGSFSTGARPWTDQHVSLWSALGP
jgi:hypothetical protein